LKHIYVTLKERFGKLKIPKQNAKVIDGGCTLRLLAQDHKRILDERRSFFIAGKRVQVSDATPRHIIQRSRSASQTPPFIVGDHLKVLANFNTNSRLRRAVEEGMVLNVLKVDREGDLLVNKQSDPWSKGDWIKKANFQNLTRVVASQVPTAKPNENESSSDDDADDNLFVTADVGMRLKDAFKFPNPILEAHGVKTDPDQPPPSTPNRTFFPPPPKPPAPKPPDPPSDSEKTFEIGEAVSCSMDGIEFHDGVVTNIAPLEIRAGPYPVGVSGWKEIRKLLVQTKSMPSPPPTPKFPPPPLEMDQTTLSLPKDRMNWLSAKKPPVTNAIDVEEAIDVIDLDEDLPEPNWGEEDLESKKVEIEPAHENEQTDLMKSDQPILEEQFSEEEEEEAGDPVSNESANDAEKEDSDIQLVLDAINLRAKSEKGASRMAIYVAIRKANPKMTTDMMRGAIMKALDAKKIVPTKGQFFAIVRNLEKQAEIDRKSKEELEGLKQKFKELNRPQELQDLKRDKFLLEMELKEIKNVMQQLLDKYPMSVEDRIRYNDYQQEYEQKSKRLEEVMQNLTLLMPEKKDDLKLEKKEEDDDSNSSGSESESEQQNVKEKAVSDAGESEEEQEPLSALKSILEMLEENEEAEKEEEEVGGGVDSLSDDLWSADEEGTNNPGDFSPLQIDPGEQTGFPRPCWYKHKKREWRRGQIVGDLDTEWLIEIPGKYKAYTFPKKAVRYRKVSETQDKEPSPPTELSPPEPLSQVNLRPKMMKIPSYAVGPGQCCYLFEQCQGIGYCVTKRSEQRFEPVIPEYGTSPFPDATVMKTPVTSPVRPSLESLADAIDAYKSQPAIGGVMEDLARLETMFEAKRQEEQKAADDGPEYDLIDDNENKPEEKKENLVAVSPPYEDPSDDDNDANLI